MAKLVKFVLLMGKQKFSKSVRAYELHICIIDNHLQGNKMCVHRQYSEMLGTIKQKRIDR